MKRVLIILLFIFSLPSYGEESDIDNNDPKVRESLLKAANQYTNSAKFHEAYGYYIYAIKNWQKPEQIEDLKQACNHLFGLLYIHKLHEKKKELMEGCPKEELDKNYGNVDREHVAILKYAPIIPKRAKKLGLDGWVLTEYDINEKGKAINIVVVESTNKIFESPAVKSVKKYVYLPKIVGGKAVTTKGVKNKITFNLSDQ